MKKLFVIAALLMATTAAHAGNSVSFEIGGHKIHIEAPKDCSTLSCLKVSSPDGTGFDFKGFKSKHLDDDVADPTPQNAAPAPAPAPAQAAAPQPAAPASSTVASTDSTPGVGFETRSAPAAPAAPAPAASQPAPVAAAPVAAPGTPIGLWATEENKGNVRVEQCGQDLCGFTDKTNEKILINMRPSDSKWVGRIHDPNSGRTYDSTIAMKGPNAMRVQGCAFGGMFCGGQTWKRVS
jgi:uncharacterized protein (DUF2147 family)